jgi:hypothetical protein
MKITIELDEKNGTAPPTTSVGHTAAVPATVSSAALSPEVLATAAAMGALNGGPAPNLSGTGDSSPNAFLGQSSASQAASATAGGISAGPAAQARPCS